ncbi:peptidoglycan-binding protein [Leifsonia sp. EB34]|uniref:peptidoglycan-binding protein n=1 Tax=Leifsonia sp. EB34 TaxID=3156303 RepID=UPI00351128F3
MPRTERRRALWIALAVVAIVAAGAGGAAWASGRTAPSAPPAVPTSSATVISTTLSSTTQLSGTLGHGAARTVFSPVSGTVTATAPVGSTVAQGAALFAVDDRPVLLLAGTVPAWRDLSVGVPPGPDVTQLEQDLVALGFATGLDLTVDGVYTDTTATAVQRWQRSLGLPATGDVPRSLIVFESSPLRILGVAAQPGSRVGDGQPALSVGSTQVLVSADVPVTQTSLVHVGDAVTVTLPAGAHVTAHVTAVSAVATSPEGSGSGSGQQNGPPTVPATVVLDYPAAAAGLDQAPVTIDVTDRTVHDALAVPITALVALQGGGYGVYVRHGATRTLVGVTPGLFADTLVQVTSSALHAGDEVVVPSP